MFEFVPLVIWKVNAQDPSEDKFITMWLQPTRPGCAEHVVKMPQITDGESPPQVTADARVRPAGMAALQLECRGQRAQATTCWPALIPDGHWVSMYLRTCFSLCVGALGGVAMLIQGSNHT